MRCKCMECEHIKTYEPRYTMNNLFTGKRLTFMCGAANKGTYEYYRVHKIKSMTGFLGYSKAGEKILTRKTAPAWCPKYYSFKKED